MISYRLLASSEPTNPAAFVSVSIALRRANSSATPIAGAAMESHPDDLLYPCSQCDAHLTTPRAHADHEKLQHTACGVCSKVSVRSTAREFKHHEHCAQHPMHDYTPEDQALHHDNKPPKAGYVPKQGAQRSTFTGNWQPPAPNAQSHVNYRPPHDPQLGYSAPHHQPGHQTQPQPQQQYYGGYLSQPHQAPTAQPQVPPGYYLASDGRVYPLPSQ